MSTVTQNKSVQDRYLEFNLGTQCFAIPLLQVREVLGVPKTTPIPHAPKYFVGIMNLRGKVLSILDLRVKMGITPKEKNQEEAVVIIEVGNSLVGAIVDSVNTVLAVEPEKFSEPPEMEMQKTKKYFKGIYRKENQLVMLIDLPQVLDLDDLSAIKSQQQQAA